MSNWPKYFKAQGIGAAGILRRFDGPETPGWYQSIVNGEWIRDNWTLRDWQIQRGSAFVEVPAPEGECDPDRIYPCDDCGKLRTAAEGGTTFTVCDTCWEKRYGKPPAAPTDECSGLTYLLIEDNHIIATADNYNQAMTLVQVRPVSGHVEIWEARKVEGKP